MNDAKPSEIGSNSKKLLKKHARNIEFYIKQLNEKHETESLYFHCLRHKLQTVLEDKGILYIRFCDRYRLLKRFSHATTSHNEVEYATVLKGVI